MFLLIEVLGLALLGAAAYWFLNARAGRREKQRLLEKLAAQTDQIRDLELRLRRVEIALSERPQAGPEILLGASRRRAQPTR